jgi:cell division transport system permease protein
MFFVTIKRVIRSGFLNFWRNAFISTTSILVMVITLIFIGSIIFLSAILTSTLDGVRGQVDLSVSFVLDASSAEILALKEELEKRPDVASVEYTSREEVFENFQKRNSGDRIITQTIDELENNPLGANLTIQAYDPESYQDIAAFLEPEPTLGAEESIVSRINFRDLETAIQRLSSLLNAVERFGMAITVALGFISILITFNTVRLIIYTARDETSVMRLVGASTSYIRGPFVISGILYGIVAALLTLAIFYPLTFWLGNMTEEFFIGLNVFTYYLDNFVQIFLLTIFSGIFIGGISSYMAVRRYLKV